MTSKPPTPEAKAAVRAWLGDIHSTVDYASLEKRFWALTNLSEVEDPKTECVVWRNVGRHYPTFIIKGFAQYAHRVAARIGLGEIPPRAVPSDMVVDHAKARGCVMPGCVNPYHLDVVDQIENMRRTRGSRVDLTTFS